MAEVEAPKHTSMAAVAHSVILEPKPAGPVPHSCEPIMYGDLAASDSRHSISPLPDPTRWTDLPFEELGRLWQLVIRKGRAEPRESITSTSPHPAVTGYLPIAHHGVWRWCMSVRVQELTMCTTQPARHAHADCVPTLVRSQSAFAFSCGLRSGWGPYRLGTSMRGRRRSGNTWPEIAKT